MLVEQTLNLMILRMSQKQNKKNYSSLLRHVLSQSFPAIYPLLRSTRMTHTLPRRSTGSNSGGEGGLGGCNFYGKLPPANTEKQISAN